MQQHNLYSCNWQGQEIFFQVLGDFPIKVNRNCFIPYIFSHKKVISAMLPRSLPKYLPMKKFVGFQWKQVTKMTQWKNMYKQTVKEKGNRNFWRDCMQKKTQWRTTA